MERFRHPIIAFAGGPQAIGSRIMVRRSLRAISIPHRSHRMASTALRTESIESLPKVGSTRVYRAVPPK